MTRFVFFCGRLRERQCRGTRRQTCFLRGCAPHCSGWLRERERRNPPQHKTMHKTMPWRFRYCRRQKKVLFAPAARFPKKKNCTLPLLLPPPSPHERGYAATLCGVRVPRGRADARRERWSSLRCRRVARLRVVSRGARLSAEASHAPSGPSASRLALTPTFGVAVEKKTERKAAPTARTECGSQFHCRTTTARK